ncbi:MAG: HAMP domain-containing histidine kinase [Gammaproteobacteria bacterium]|nr:HAMP domain-containing histidine kinase [Gammaproteobacteria bacterium]
MAGASFTGLSRKRLRRWLILFFLLLAIPTAILVQQAHSQLTWEAFHLHRLLAEELTTRIDNQIVDLIGQEAAHPFGAYRFFQLVSDPSAPLSRRSPLATYPVETTIPGLIGYFQVDAEGRFSTPLLPESEQIAPAHNLPTGEHRQRQALATRLQRILSENRLVEAKVITAPRRDTPPARHHLQKRGSVADINQAQEEIPRPLRQSPASREKKKEGATTQAAFDQLMESSVSSLKENASPYLSRVEDLKLQRPYPATPQDEQRKKSRSPTPFSAGGSARQEQENRLGKTVHGIEAKYDQEESSHPRILTFESEIDPFELSLLGSGHFVLFRKVWREGNRYIQGALISEKPFLRSIVKGPFQQTGLSRMSDLIVAFQGNVVSTYKNPENPVELSDVQQLEGTILYDSHLSAPFNDLELIFSITRLPPGPGSTLVTWTAIILTVLLSGGFYSIYRLGARQIDLTRQQQDFVSAVSHELKTPLTSIRMYGEILLQGWASETKKRDYYGYIHDESERLSRLITNLLHLARVNRNELDLDIRVFPAGELMDELITRLTSQIERTGFRLAFDCPEKFREIPIHVDHDGFTRVFINLVDNAIKFSSRAETRIIKLSCGHSQDGSVSFSVRDYGAGIPKEQIRKIFLPFFRLENELTRETTGTGIGLALVDRLVASMDGHIDVINRQPGTEFRIILPGREQTN